MNESNQADAVEGEVEYESNATQLQRNTDADLTYRRSRRGGGKRFGSAAAQCRTGRTKGAVQAEERHL